MIKMDINPPKPEILISNHSEILKTMLKDVFKEIDLRVPVGAII